MTKISKNIFVVNCDFLTFNELFSKKKNSEVINYKEIKQRLTNNDVFKSPPSSEVVEFQIIKKLNSFSKCKKTEFLFFYTEKISINFLDNLKIHFKECQYPVLYHLVHDDDVKIPNKYHKEFNSVQKLDNDKK